MSNPTLAPIYDRLAGTDNYHPFTAETFADWASEPGDTVRISRGGTEYEAPVHAQTILWRGKTTVQMESAGTKDREPIERTSNRKYNGTSSGQSNARTTAGMMGGLVADNKHLLYVVEDPQNGLVHKFEVTAEALTSEITRATQAENGLQVDISSLEQDISGVRTTVGTIEGQVVTMAGTLTTITGSALWTQRNEITGVVGEFDVVESGGTKTLIVKSGGGMKIRRDNVEYGIYDDGTLTAGVIATKVNGTSSTYIYADKILMSSASGANTVQVEVNGKITADEITAQFLSSKISSIATLVTNSIIIQDGGTLATTGYIAGGQVRTSELVLSNNSVTDLIKDASVSADNLTLTLTKASGATVTFSKATILTGGWGNSGVYTVNASPQGVSISTSVSANGGTGGIADPDYTANAFISHKAYVEIKGTQTSGSVVIKKILVNAESEYNSGYDTARGYAVLPNVGTGETFIVKTPKADRTGSNENTFSLSKGTPSASGGYVSVFLAGTGVVGRIDISNWWEEGYEAGLLENGWNEGYDTARGYAVLPSGGSGETFIVKTPKADRTGSNENTFSLSKGTPSASGGYVSAFLAGTGVVGRIDISNWWEEGYKAGLVASGYNIGYSAGWDAACGKVTRTGNKIKAPQVGTSSGGNPGTDAVKYTANYTASSNTYTPSSYTSPRYRGSTYQQETVSYTPSSHTHTDPYVELYGVKYYSTVVRTNYNGPLSFIPGNDSYSPSGYVYTASTYSASEYTAPTYKASSNSYTASSFSWTDS